MAKRDCRDCRNSKIEGVALICTVFKYHDTRKNLLTTAARQIKDCCGIEAKDFQPKQSDDEQTEIPRNVI